MLTGSFSEFYMERWAFADLLEYIISYVSIYSGIEMNHYNGHLLIQLYVMGAD